MTRTHLVDAAGIARDHIVSDPSRSPVGIEGERRVEFALQPARPPGG